MATSCKPLGNTGAAVCPFLMKVARRMILVPEFDANGVKNEFASIDDVTLENLQLKFDAADPLERFYTLPLMENVEDVRAETVFFNWESGQKVRIRQGARSFTAALPNDATDTTLLGNLQDWYGQRFGVYIIDKAGNFIYNESKDGVTVEPIMVDGNSFDVNLVKETYSDPLYTMLTFDFREDINDASLRYIKYDDLDFDGRTDDCYGLWDIEITEETPAPTTTETVFSVATEYEVPVTGLVVDDVTIYNITQSAAIVPASLVEDVTVSGKYTLTYPTATAADVLQITISKSRYNTTSIQTTPLV